MCTLMQKDVLIENLAETTAFIGMRYKGVENAPVEFKMCGLLRYFILTHDPEGLNYDAINEEIAALRKSFENKPVVM